MKYEKNDYCMVKPPVARNMHRYREVMRLQRAEQMRNRTVGRCYLLVGFYISTIY